MKNVTYDRLKWVAQIGLPGFATFYATVALIWGLPEPEKVVATIVAVDTLLGLYLGLKTKQYRQDDDRFDGFFVVHEEPDEEEPHRVNVKVAQDLNFEPEELIEKDEVVMKVLRPNREH